jgi:hypothetical protein
MCCALQGFLPERADQFAQDIVYPAFSPSVATFLALSTLYGIWKVLAISKFLVKTSCCPPEQASSLVWSVLALC